MPGHGLEKKKGLSISAMLDSGICISAQKNELSDTDLKEFNDAVEIIKRLASKKR